MCQETCLGLIGEQIAELVLPRLAEQDRVIASEADKAQEQTLLFEALQQAWEDWRIEAEATFQAKREDLDAKFSTQQDETRDYLNEQADELKLAQGQFKAEIKEAFDIFKESTELE